MCVVHVHYRTEATSFSLCEIALVLGLVYASPGHVVAARLVGGLPGAGGPPAAALAQGRLQPRALRPRDVRGDPHLPVAARVARSALTDRLGARRSPPPWRRWRSARSPCRSPSAPARADGPAGSSAGSSASASSPPSAAAIAGPGRRRRAQRRERRRLAPRPRGRRRLRSPTARTLGCARTTAASSSSTTSRGPSVPSSTPGRSTSCCSASSASSSEPTRSSWCSARRTHPTLALTLHDGAVDQVVGERRPTP